MCSSDLFTEIMDTKMLIALCVIIFIRYDTHIINYISDDLVLANYNRMLWRYNLVVNDFINYSYGDLLK